VRADRSGFDSTRMSGDKLWENVLFIFVAQEREDELLLPVPVCADETQKNAFMSGDIITRFHHTLCFNSTNRCVTIDIVMETVYSIYWRTSRKIITGAWFPMFYGLGNWKSKDLTKLVSWEVLPFVVNRIFLLGRANLVRYFTKVCQYLIVNRKPHFLLKIFIVLSHVTNAHSRLYELSQK
jgi:hypothetical protein